MDPVIVARNLYKRYPGFAPVLRGANLEVAPGEMVAIMGPSGCGKSTMLHILGLLHAPDSGELDILGRNALDIKEDEIAGFRRANLGFVMQASNLFEHSTVFENVEFPLIYENVPPQERWERVIRALDLVRLSHRVHYPGNRLSGGEQQRVAIARAMVNNPRILLADEPTGALDARTSRLIMENFRGLCHDGGVSLVMVTHDPKMADFCDSVYSLEDGVLVSKKHSEGPFAKNTAQDFLKAPQPAMFGALVSRRFPNPDDPDSLVLARRLHEAGLLARIYALAENGLLGNSTGYSLPLPVRRAGFWAKLFGLRLFFSSPAEMPSLGSLWKRFPGAVKGGIAARLAAFAAGALFGRWGMEDAIQLFYATSPGMGATAAWVASRRMKMPFVFEITGRDIGAYDGSWPLKATDCVFIACSSASVRKHAMDLLPGIPEEKFLLVYPLVPVQPARDEVEQTVEDRKFLEILCPGPDISFSGCSTVISACAQLKKEGVVFRLSIQSAKSGKLAKMAEKLGLGGEVVFLGKTSLDNLGESYKTAQIFVAFPPDDKGMGLEIPVYVREAMAFGLAIAATGLSEGMAEALKDSQNCLVAQKPGDPGLAEAMLKLCSDAKERSRLGANAASDLAALLNPEGTTRMLADRLAQAVGEAERKADLTMKAV